MFLHFFGVNGLPNVRIGNLPLTAGISIIVECGNYLKMKKNLKSSWILWASLVACGLTSINMATSSDTDLMALITLKHFPHTLIDNSRHMEHHSEVETMCFLCIFQAIYLLRFTTYKKHGESKKLDEYKKVFTPLFPHSSCDNDCDLKSIAINYLENCFFLVGDFYSEKKLQQ